MGSYHMVDENRDINDLSEEEFKAYIREKRQTWRQGDESYCEWLNLEGIMSPAEDAQWTVKVLLVFLG